MLIGYRGPTPNSLKKQLLEAKREIELLNHKMALKDVLMDLKLPETGCDRTKKK